MHGTSLYVRSISCALAVASLAGLLIFAVEAKAQIGVMQSMPGGPAETTCVDMRTLKQVPCPDKQLVQDAELLVGRLYNESKFDQLDALFLQWCAGKERFPDGQWKLSTYGDALSKNFSAWQRWDADLKKIQKWRSQSPTSAAAWYAAAVYWRAYAWQARGQGYAGSVSKEGWEIFKERLETSRSTIESSIGEKPQCPAAYPLWLNLMLELGAPVDQHRAIFTRAQSQFPEYHQIYFAMARRFDPKWRGSIDQYERFATEATRLTQSFEGKGMYARIYWLVDYDEGIPFKNSSTKPPAWSQLKAGYEDLLQRYPSSNHNLGKYAGVVCRTSNSDLYRSLRSRLEGYENGAEFVDPVEVCDRRHSYKRPTN